MNFAFTYNVTILPYEKTVNSWNGRHEIIIASAGSIIWADQHMRTFEGESVRQSSTTENSENDYVIS